MKFWVTEEEKRLIDEKMAQLPTKRCWSYLWKILGGKYAFILTTHIDRDHVHNHLIFNAVSFTDHKHYHSNRRSYHEIRRTSGRLLPGCTDLEDLLRCLQREGYELKRRKYISARAPGRNGRSHRQKDRPAIGILE